ncbi:MAG: hypothetical protein KDB00_17745 [Planctomycetales bacterium]|nr:hypothetical protein [Planctomycetales bacterium]
MIQVKAEHKTKGTIFGKPMKLADLQPARQITYNNRVRPTKSEEAVDDFEISVVPDYMWDWKMRPDNGDLLGLSGTKPCVYLFKGSTLGSDDYSNLPSFDLPGLAVAACWKQFGDRNYWIVLCSDDNRAHVIDADAVSMLDPIKLDARNFSKDPSITTSSNPKDPFVYFCGDNNRKLRAIDLRSMTDSGAITEKFYDSCHISPNGDIITVSNGNNSEHLAVTRGLDGVAPKVGKLSRDSRQFWDGWIDPLQEYAQSGNGIRRNEGDEGVVATLGGGEIAFYFAGQPVVAEINKTDPTGSRSKNGYLQFWSLDTGESLGKKQMLPGVFVEEGFPRDVNPTKRLTYSRRRGLFADESNGSIVLAVNNQIYHRPIASLDFPDHRRLVPRFGQTTFQVGVESVLEIQAANPEVKITYQALAPGMEQDEKGLKWRPTANAIGDHTVTMTMSYGDQSRVIEIPIEVVSPYLTLPIEVRDFLISPRADFCVAWAGDPRRTRESDPPKLALISLRDKTQVKQADIAHPIMKAVLLGTQLVTWTPENREHLSVYDLRSLAVVKTILAPDGIETFDTDGKVLRIQCERSIETYNAKSLTRISSESKRPFGSQPARSSVIYLDGTLDKGVFRDVHDGKPMLFVTPGQIYVHGVRRFDLVPEGSTQFLRTVSADTSPFKDEQHRPVEMIYIDQSSIPDSSLRVSLWMQTTTNERTLRLALLTAEGAIAGVPICREPREGTKPEIMPALQTASKTVYIASGQRLYRWNQPESLDMPFVDIELDSKPYFVPRQSEFVLRGRSPKLEHQVVGGKAPYEFTLFTDVGGMDLDPTTGAISINSKELSERLAQSRASIFSLYKDGGTFEVQLEKAADQRKDEFEQMTGQKAKGFPTAIPIKIKAVDQNGDIAQLDYYVMFDLPLGEIIRMRKALGK